MTKLFIFDYDNTIAHRKSPASPEIISSLVRLQENHDIAVLTGDRTYKQFKDWVVKKMPKSNNILLCTEYGNIVYRKDPCWTKIYHATKFNTSYKGEILQLWERP
ncbi:hypothetical protein K8R14_01245 [bacterium]|nr:hypothetical protein [bacterium]